MGRKRCPATTVSALLRVALLVFCPGAPSSVVEKPFTLTYQNLDPNVQSFEIGRSSDVLGDAPFHPLKVTGDVVEAHLNPVHLGLSCCVQLACDATVVEMAPLNDLESYEREEEGAEAHKPLVGTKREWDGGGRSISCNPLYLCREGHVTRRDPALRILSARLAPLVRHCRSSFSSLASDSPRDSPLLTPGV